MPIVPLFGHAELQTRLREATHRGALPASMLFEGPRGVGKQRLAIWLAQFLLCREPDHAPCGHCQSCRYTAELTHPDLHWYFPRPRLKDSDPDLATVREDYAEAIAERADANGLYEPPSGSEGIYVATVRALVQQSVISPAIGNRKVFIIGDAERMVPQEGSEQAANAFLKLLEEPPSDTTIVITSSESGSLLPTIRSRVASVRVKPLRQAEVEAFLSNEAVRKRLKGEATLPVDIADAARLAGGAPGRLLSGAAWAQALETAYRLIDAATGKAAARYDAAWQMAPSKARGSFADTLDALTVALHARARSAVHQRSNAAAAGAARAMEAVEIAKERITTNVSPQLITVNLLRDLQEALT
ncbi:MAG TPA: hypothetical protein VEB19_18440 [Gemmatimonadaceae bacterium]|nr:hypothetical protein [Gemmatimonadaceae bacterium]